MSMVVIVLTCVAAATMGWITVRGEVNSNELSVDYGLFEVCTRIRAQGVVEFDACQDTEDSVRTDSLATFGLLFAAIVIEFFACLCFMYLVVPSYRECCDMVGSKKGSREWYAGCILLVVAAILLMCGNLVYYSNFNELVDQYDKEARLIDRNGGYGRFSYSFFLVGAAALLNWIAILFIVYEIIMTRRTHESRVLKKQQELLERIEEANLRKKEREAEDETDDLGPVARAELERQKRREEKRQRLAAQRRKKRLQKAQAADLSASAFSVDPNAESSSDDYSSSNSSSYTSSS